MLSTCGKFHVLLCICALVLSDAHQAIGSQADDAARVESLSAEDIIAGLTANLNRIRTYKATFVVSDPNGKDAREFQVGWERVSEGDLANIPDKRFYIITPLEDSESSSSEWSLATHFAYNGEKAFRCEIMSRGRTEIREGEILPTIDDQITGIGLTLATLSTHYGDETPIQRIVANGTFVKEGIETVHGRKCVALYGGLGYAEPGPFQVKSGSGVYVKLVVDPLSGFMPVEQEFYWVDEVDGRLVREEPYLTYTARLKEFDGGVWFPVAGSCESESTKRVLTVKECALNIDIPQEEFSITTWPPGTWVEDRVANTSFRVGRGS